MAKVETFACDECGAQKGKTNGWFRAIVKAREYFLVSPWDYGLTELLLLRLVNMPDDSFQGSEQKDYCSESCAAKAMSKVIGQSSVKSEDHLRPLIANGRDTHSL